MSCMFTICNSCDHLMNHRLVKRCESCNSTDVFQDVDMSESYEGDYDHEDDEEQV